MPGAPQRRSAERSVMRDRLHAAARRSRARYGTAHAHEYAQPFQRAAFVADEAVSRCALRQSGVLPFCVHERDGHMLLRARSQKHARGRSRKRDVLSSRQPPLPQPQHDALFSGAIFACSTARGCRCYQTMAEKAQPDTAIAMPQESSDSVAAMLHR